METEDKQLQFYERVCEIVSERDATFIEAVLEYAQELDADKQMLDSLICQDLRFKLIEEAEEMNIIPKTKKLF